MDNIGQLPAAEIESGDERQTIMTRALRLGYVATNGVASLVELVAGTLSGNVAVAVDGAHGSAEIFLGNTQMKDAHETDHVSDRRRKAIYITLCSIASGAACIAGVETTHIVQLGASSPMLDSVGLGAAAVSAGSGLTAAGIIVKRVREKYGAFFRNKNQHTRIEGTEKDVVKHIVKYDAPSSAMAFISGMARVINQGLHTKGRGFDYELIEHLAGVASGAWGAFLFRPTKANLEHHHDERTHETLPEAVEELVNLRQ